MTKSRDFKVGLIGFIFGLAVIFMTSRLPDSKMAGDIGPRVFPYISGTLMTFCGGVLALISRRKNPAKDRQFLDRAGAVRLVTLLAVLIAYAVSLGKCGFLIPSMLCLFLLMTMFSESGQVRLWKRILISVLVSLAIYVAFTKGLSLRLPLSGLEKSLNRLF